MVGDSAWARANLSEPGYCLANWRLALRYWTADIIMAVSFVSEPEPTWQMIGALLRCKQCKPGIFSVKSGDNPPKMKRFCDSLYSVCWPPRPRRSARGWWAGARGWRPPCTASERTPRECPGQAGGPCQRNGVVNVYLVLLLWEWITLISILPVALSLCFCSKYLSLLVCQSLSLPWSFIDDESKTLW